MHQIWWYKKNSNN